jgi:type I restriction enzyme R subunit
MNEAETRAEHIDPVLKAAGWGVVENSRIRREYKITEGRIQTHGKREKPLIADYVLIYRGHNLAVLEAKAWDKPLTEGMAQAKNYAGKLALRFAYSSNGQGFYAIDMQTGKEGKIAEFPSPETLWNTLFSETNAWRDRFAQIPFEDRGGYFQLRYYQTIAVERVLTAITENQQRILLTLATGTGKTFIAFQIAWKLFKSRWNLSREPNRQPRILFLADRNILADQAFNAFSAFPDDALVRIAPDEIRKKGTVPKNGSVFFTIFQTFMSGNTLRQAQGEREKEAVRGESSNTVRGELVEPRSSTVRQAHSSERTDGAYFGDYSPDFFDFIVIDECHRGGANDESNWRGILDYFAPAVQLGLTATPKRQDNADTYAYFGEPAFIYSLKDGINAGFLTPFRLKQISTDLDEYVYKSDDTVIEGEIEEAKTYTEADFNKIIEIEERERKRVELFLSQLNQNEKTLVFCANQNHALAIRDLINQLKTSTNPNYCHRVTADDSKLGEQYLREFQDNEKTIPTILTTSQKLSTGVDARNVRNIVLLRPVNSMIEFKQIIGRGTRLYEDKSYFTIYDFVKAHHHFSDPEWDGEPEDPENCSKCGCYPCQCEKIIRENNQVKEPAAEYKPSKKIKVKLADGKEREIQHTMTTTFWHSDGTPMTAQQFIEELFGKLPEFFKNEAELRDLWSKPDTRKQLLSALAEKGFDKPQLQELQKIIDAEKSDLFDVLANVAYALPPLTREQRAEKAKIIISTHFNTKQQVFLDFVLSHYVSIGVDELDQDKLKPLLDLKYHSIHDAMRELGKPDEIRSIFDGFQQYLYQQQQAA